MVTNRQAAFVPYVFRSYFKEFLELLQFGGQGWKGALLKGPGSEFTFVKMSSYYTQKARMKTMKTVVLEGRQA